MEENIFYEENERMERRGKSQGRFWEREDPLTVEDNRLQWKFYRLAGKLQIIRFYGYEKRQILTLDRRAITPEMVKVLKEFISEAEKENK